jgi:hypothetical protein
MLALKQFVLWLATLWWTFVVTFGIPTNGCLSGHRMAMCWRIPQYGYVVSVAAYANQWTVLGCVPGATYHQSQIGREQFDRQLTWWCSAEGP